MSHWFRYYDETLNDPKVQRLPDNLFKAWVNLLCVASANEGEIPSLADAAFALRLPETQMGAIVAQLAKRELLDPVPGRYFRPHNWDGRQYKSDVSTDRVKRFRERKRNVAETPSDTEQIQSQKTEQNEGKKLNGKGGRGPLPHGTISQSRGTVFIRHGTNDWAAYAEDFRATNGYEPQPNSDGGYWFKTAGAAALPEPKRMRA